MSKKFSDLKVGDEVYIVEDDQRHRNARDVRVCKTGRKFVHVEVTECRILKFEAWEFDGYALGVTQDYPQSKIYASKEDYEEMIAWKEVLSKLQGFSATSSLSREQRKLISEIVSSR